MDIQADYSCYIRINNKTDVDFGLEDTEVKEGKWPSGQPPNTINAHRPGDVHLADAWGDEGAIGSVTYGFQLKGIDITVKIEFKDPFSPTRNNYLGGSSSHPEQVSIDVHPYSQEGHPFYGEVDVYAVGSKSLNDGESAVTEESRFNANYSIGFELGGEISINKDPVHENIAIAAFIQAQKLPRGTTYNNLDKKQWEYFRGLVWNDDPSCLLFKDNSANNRDWGVGLEWYDQFKYGAANCMTKRSHFGDLQCLHGMASKTGEAAETTKQSILMWMEVMYKLACDNQGVATHDKLKTVLPTQFNGSTMPNDDATMKQLLLATTPSYRFSNVQSRGLGVCLHIIQDSYAVGHTQRCLLNPGDLAGRDDDGYMRFKSGTYGRWGSIISFHCYSGQDSDRHSHYDSLEGTAPVPKQLDTFNKIIGARDAIDTSAALIKFFANKTKWEDGVKQFLEQEVFALASGAKPANGDVDKSVGSCRGGAAAVRAAAIDTRHDFEYMSGMQRKLASLEGGESGRDVEAMLPYNPVWARCGGKRSFLRLTLFALLGVLALVATIVSSAIMSRVVAKYLF